MTIALVFPGQGSQYVGMGLPLKETDYYKKFLEADKTLEFSLSNLCLNGPEEKLKLTEFTQPAIVTHSLALFDWVKPLLPKIDYVLGHSVGEYSALAAAGVISFQDVVKAVSLRGQYMQAATPQGIGKMIAVLKISSDWIDKACAEASTDDSVVTPANYNDPKQIVISGHAAACDRAIQWLEKNCPDKFAAIPLNVSAPFHCPLMDPAAQKMKQFLDRIQLKPALYNYVANVDAKTYPVGSDIEGIKQRLVQQVCGSVRWTQSIEALPENTKFIEVGPGKVLCGLIRRIKPQAKTLALDTQQTKDTIREFIDA